MSTRERIISVETNEGYLGPGEIFESYELDAYSLNPKLDGKVRIYKIDGRSGFIYKDAKTGKFVSEKGLAELIGIPLNL